PDREAVPLILRDSPVCVAESARSSSGRIRKRASGSITSRRLGRDDSQGQIVSIAAAVTCPKRVASRNISESRTVSEITKGTAYRRRGIVSNDCEDCPLS